MLIIRTQYKAGKVVARSNTGKQRTMPYDHALSVDRNHGEAAALLGNRTVPSGKLDQARRTMTHTVEDSGKHKFTFDV